MLESMIENPLPTRAEITDVANAVFEQADAIMLSGETTVGRHPLACIEVMDRIATRIERSGGAGYHTEADLSQPRQKLVKSAVLLADELQSPAIIVFTRSGQLAQFASALRPRTASIFAFCNADSTAARLSILRGVHAIAMPSCTDDPVGSIDGAIQRLLSQQLIRRGAPVVVLVPGSGTHDRLLDAIQMRTA
jgi:pyruvate kinase